MAQIFAPRMMQRAFGDLGAAFVDQADRLERQDHMIRQQAQWINQLLDRTRLLEQTHMEFRRINTELVANDKRALKEFRLSIIRNRELLVKTMELEGENQSLEKALDDEKELNRRNQNRIQRLVTANTIMKKNKAKKAAKKAAKKEKTEKKDKATTETVQGQ